MFAKTVTRTKDVGWLDYQMHEEGEICCAMWKDKKRVKLLFIHASPILLPRERIHVWLRFSGNRKKAPISPMHL